MGAPPPVEACALSRIRLFATLAKDCSPLDSSVHGVFQARILEWVRESFSRGSSQPGDRTCISCARRRLLHHWAAWEPPGGHSLSAVLPEKPHSVSHLLASVTVSHPFDKQNTATWLSYVHYWFGRNKAGFQAHHRKKFLKVKIWSGPINLCCLHFFIQMVMISYVNIHVNSL